MPLSSVHRAPVREDGGVSPPEPPLRIATVVLAAGGGSRFAGPTPKLLVPIDGRPLVVWAVEAAMQADVGPTVVVSGAVDLTGVLRERGVLDHVDLVVNDHWAEGQATSLAVGIGAADAMGVDAVVVGLGDQPGITPGAWRRVARADPAAPIVVATYGGRRRNPVRLARSIWPDLPVEGDEGARSLIAGRPELVTEIACPGEPDDIDTLEDLARWS